MTVSGLRIHKDLPFEEYLSLPGISYSYIKSEGAFFEPTEKMKLGTRVHNYLLTPQEYDYVDFDIVRPLSLAVKETVGPLFKFLEKELAFTANFEEEGIIMPYKGRIDMGIPNRIIVDLKVSEMPLEKSISYFGYDKQLSGYGIALNCPILIIIAVNPKTKKTFSKTIKKDLSWWQYQTKAKGAIL